MKGHFEIVQWLHTHGAATDVTRPDNNGVTPMFIACQQGHLEIVQWLHAHGATMDVTRPNNNGATPLWFACQEGHFEIVQWLLARGAALDITRPSKNGATPIGKACQRGHLHIIKHLIHHHSMTPATLEHWHPKLSSYNKRRLRQAADENLFDCQSFLTLATIVRCINIKPYKVVVPSSTGSFVRLVIPRSSILIFRRRNQHLLWSVASYICGGEETRHIWHLIRKKN
jgi:ankyrin repeat protein